MSDLDLGDEVEILDEADRIIATVSQPRIQLELEAEEAAAEAAAEGEEAAEEQPSEPEVISRRQDDDEAE